LHTKSEKSIIYQNDRGKRWLRVIHDAGKWHEVACWETDRDVLPVEDRFLLWVDYFRGFINSDPWQEMPELRYVSLTVEPNPWRSNNRGGPSYRSIYATDCGHAMRFLQVCPRCCCGCPGWTACVASRYAYTSTTWALRMDDMTTWDKVGAIDSDDLWSLPGYHGIVLRVRPEYPVVSMDDPYVLYLTVHTNMYHTDVEGYLGTWMIELDTRRMELRSICVDDDSFTLSSHFIASPISQYMDTSSRSCALARRKDTRLEAMDKPSELPRVVASPEEMLATLREIPDLARDDILKAYGVLASDESQLKFRSLLARLMHMRKDYCCLIGKLSCFDE
jgi:hypothetical protein